MVANPSKFQIIFLGLHQPHKVFLEINNQIVPSSDTVKLLGIDIDSKLSFDNYVKAVCAKASRKVSAFSRVASFITFEQAKLLYNSFIMSNFGYCPLIWMFCGKTANEEIHRIHKRALRRLYNDFNSNFEELWPDQVKKRFIYKILKSCCWRFSSRCIKFVVLLK